MQASFPCISKGWSRPYFKGKLLPKHGVVTNLRGRPRGDQRSVPQSHAWPLLDLAALFPLTGSTKSSGRAVKYLTRLPLCKNDRVCLSRTSVSEMAAGRARQGFPGEKRGITYQESCNAGLRGGARGACVSEHVTRWRINALRNLIWKGKHECCSVREEIQMNAGACMPNSVIPHSPSDDLWFPRGSCCPGSGSEG